jgi:uncharacterized protein (TIGR00251 family)
VNVRLTPKGGRDAIDGIERRGEAEVLKARVRAPPREGEANAALVRLIAKTLRVPAARVAIVGGATARVKRVKIAGDPAALVAALQNIVAD